MRTAILIRTNNFSLQTQNLIRILGSVFPDMVFPIMHTDQDNPDKPVPNIMYLNDRVVSDLGFEKVPPNWGWLCGDFCYYVAKRQIQDADRFCLIENDVSMTPAAAQHLRTLLEESNEKVLACGLRKYSRVRNFSKDLSAIGVDERWGCMFPLTSMTRQHVDLMWNVRKKAQSDPADLKINDEAILAATVDLHQLPFEDLFSFEGLFRPEYFNTHPPTVVPREVAAPPNDFIHHPVVTLDKVLKRITTGQRAYNERRLRRTMRERCPSHISRAIGNALSCNRDVVPDKEVRHENADHTKKIERTAKLLSILPSFQKLKIVDIGANEIEGQPEYLDLLQLGQCSLVGFEPQFDTVPMDPEKTQPNVQYLPHAIGDGDETEFFQTRHSGFSSTLPPDPTAAQRLGFSRAMQVVERRNLPTVQLDSIPEIEGADLVRMDVQGAEVPILSNAANTLTTAIGVQTEARLMPLYLGEPSFAELHAALESHGFGFHCWLEQKQVKLSHRYRPYLARRARRQFVDGDAVYVKGLPALDALSNTELSKLAVMGDSIFGSLDLTLLCLAILVERQEIANNDVLEYLYCLPDSRLRIRPDFPKDFL